MSSSSPVLSVNSLQYEPSLSIHLQEAYIEGAPSRNQLAHQAKKAASRMYVHVKFTATGAVIVAVNVATGASLGAATGFSLGLASSAIISIASNYFPNIAVPLWAARFIKYGTGAGVVVGGAIAGVKAALEYRLEIRDQYCAELLISQRQIYSTIWGKKAQLVGKFVGDYFAHHEAFEPYCCPVTMTLMMMPVHLPQTASSGQVKSYEYEGLIGYLEKEIATGNTPGNPSRVDGEGRVLCPFRTQRMKPADLVINFRLMRDQAAAINGFIRDFVAGVSANQSGPASGNLKRLAQRLIDLEGLPQAADASDDILTSHERNLVKTALLPIFQALQKRNIEHRDFVTTQLGDRRYRKNEISQEQFLEEMACIGDFYRTLKINLESFASEER